jgi:hypothetical protein
MEDMFSAKMRQALRFGVEFGTMSLMDLVLFE